MAAPVIAPTAAAAPGVDQALAELRRCAGTQFDPAVVEAFCAEFAENGRPAYAPASRAAERSLAAVG